MTDSLLEVMAREPKVVKYIDLPLQHANEKVLREMNRNGSFESLTALMQRIRDKVPGVVLRTTFIAGSREKPKKNLHSLLSLSVRYVSNVWAALLIPPKRILQLENVKTRSMKR